MITEIAIDGQERVAETIRLCKMNLATVSQAMCATPAPIYEDLHKSIGNSISSI